MAGIRNGLTSRVRTWQQPRLCLRKSDGCETGSAHPTFCPTRVSSSKESESKARIRVLEAVNPGVTLRVRASRLRVYTVTGGACTRAAGIPAFQKSPTKGRDGTGTPRVHPPFKRSQRNATYAQNPPPSDVVDAYASLRGPRRDATRLQGQPCTHLGACDRPPAPH